MQPGKPIQKATPPRLPDHTTLSVPMAGLLALAVDDQSSFTFHSRREPSRTGGRTLITEAHTAVQCPLTSAVASVVLSHLLANLSRYQLN